MLRLRVVLSLAAAALFGGAPGAAAQDYPSKPITLIVPFPAGGGVAVIGRIVGEKLAAELGQPVIIDNRGGAAGIIGTRVAARCPVAAGRGHECSTGALLSVPAARRRCPRAVPDDCARATCRWQ